MSTNAHIGWEDPGGEIDYIYLHWDGYIDDAGVKLLGHHNNQESAWALTHLGDCSALRETIDGSIFYHRDRGDPREDTKAITVANRDEFLEDHCEYKYLFTSEGEWIVKGGGFDGYLSDAVKEVGDL